MNEDRLAKLSKMIEGSLLNDWERRFVNSVTDQWNRRKDLSPRQVEIVEKIEKKYSAEEQNAREAWVKSFDDEKKRIAKLVAHYYQGTGYFRDLVRTIIESKDNDFTMTERQYNAMCCNKYAKKVLDAASGEPLYPVGSMVSIRKSLSGVNIGGIRTAWRRAKTDLVVVLSANEPIVSAAKGCKTYKVVFVGDSEPVTIEERDLKRMKKSLNKKKKSASN
tara:strand:- start:335 stop:994 length:660 start_codon:yes stop_codon:yes gene_type:complete